MCEVRINFGLSDRWVESVVSAIRWPVAETKLRTRRCFSERLIQKVKSPTVCVLVSISVCMVRNESPRWRQRTKLTTEVNNKKHTFVHKNELICLECAGLCRKFFSATTEYNWCGMDACRFWIYSINIDLQILHSALTNSARVLITSFNM